MVKIIIILFFIPLISWAQIITEVQIRGEEANNDFIVIYNPTLKDLTGWRLKKRTSTGSEQSIRVFPETPIKEYIVWSHSDFPIEADLNSKTSLANNNSIALIDVEGNIIDAVAWGESENPFTEPWPNNPSRLIRKKENDQYSQTGNILNDFYNPEEKEEKEIKTKSVTEEKKPFPWIFPLSISLFGGITILLMKKYVRTQSLENN